ncbi:MAG: glycosyltransferase [Candidatus Hydrogenedentes bacterium]|nr:glycosyltransferase [Candidatus Hydrogenedentota bacterium]
MRPSDAWRTELRGQPARDDVQILDSRTGKPTLKAGAVLLHSRYDPEREAAQLVTSAGLDSARPVLVVGLGLGYHVLELLRRGLDTSVVEPDATLARCALEGPAANAEFLLGVGDIEAIAESGAFQNLARRMPQVLVHPPTARLHPRYVDAVRAALARCAFAGVRLSVAVVGPMYGGSLPITQYLADAFRALGHRTLQVDNAAGWPVYELITQSVGHGRAKAQLGQMVTNLLGEWTYARVAEFNPEICIVLAQAPVGPSFPARLAESGTVSAFWFVENWRHMPYWRQVAREYDYFFHIQPGAFDRELDAIGCRHHAFVQTGCDPAVHRPVELAPEERDEYSCDISFAGAGYYNRNRFFRGLTDYKFKIWGVNWTPRELARLVQRPEQRFTSEEFMKIVAGSRISLNLHSSNRSEGVDPGCDAINPRVFEIAAAGGFQLCDPCIGLESHFDFNTELPVFTSLSELRRKIDYFLAHPAEREQVAQRARDRALRDHTYERRAQQMLDLILEQHGPRLLKRGIRVQRSVAEVLERAGSGGELEQYLALWPKEALFTYDTLLDVQQRRTGEDLYAARVFAYLREVRDFAEALLKERR